MDKTTDPNANDKTKTSSILNELPQLPNTGLCSTCDARQNGSVSLLLDV